MPDERACRIGENERHEHENGPGRNIHVVTEKRTVENQIDRRARKTGGDRGGPSSDADVISSPRGCFRGAPTETTLPNPFRCDQAIFY